MVFVTGSQFSVLEIDLDLIVHPVIDIFAAQARDDADYTKRNRHICNKSGVRLVSSFLSTDTEASSLNATSNDFFLSDTHSGHYGRITSRRKVGRPDQRHQGYYFAIWKARLDSGGRNKLARCFVSVEVNMAR